MYMRYESGEKKRERLWFLQKLREKFISSICYNKSLRQIPTLGNSSKI